MILFPLSFWNKDNTPPPPPVVSVLDLNAAIITVADGDPVAFWHDISPQGNDFSQSDVSRQPIFINDGSGPNSLPFVRSDGVDDSLFSADTASLRLSDSGAALALVFRSSQTGNDIFPFSHFVPSSPFGWALRFLGGQAGFENLNGWESGGQVIVDGTWHAVLVRWSNRYATAIVDGVAQFTVPRLWVDPPALIGDVATGAALFTLGNNLAPFAGDIYAARAFASVLTPKNVQDLFINWQIATGVPWAGDSKIHICFQGDSLTLGTGAPAGQSYPDQLAAMIADPDQIAIENNGIAGATINRQFSNICRNAPTEWQTCLNHYTNSNYIIMWGGTNDLATDGATPAEVLQEIKDFFSAARAMYPAGVKLVSLTILPRTSNGMSPTFEVDRQTLNAALRALPLGQYFDVLCDVGNNPLIGQPGDQDNLAYFADDKTHLNTAGYAIVAQAVGTAIGEI